MKLRKILGWGLGAALGVLALAALGGYCWLFSWSWGSAPSPYAGFSAEEARQLQTFDTYLTEQYPEILHAYMKQEVLTRRTIEASLDVEESETQEIRLTWSEELALWGLSAKASRLLLVPVRRGLHAMLKSGAADKADPYMMVLALQRHDVPLFKLFVEKGLGVNPTFAGKNVNLLAEAMGCLDLQGNSLPIAERLELLEWLVARGADINSVSEEDMLLISEASIRASDDKGAALLAWLLRKGAKVNPNRTAIILLQHAGTLATYQQLIAEKILPETPAVLPTEKMNYTPLRLVAGASEPSVEMARWLLSQGHSPNLLPDRTNADDRSQHPLDVCLSGMQYCSFGQGETEDARLRRKMELLDILLQHGALPTDQTRSLLPFNAGMEREIVELFRKHGHHITAGDNPYNACCVPE